MAKRKGHWSLGLLRSLEDPTCQVLSSDEAVVIKDKYPKSKYHFLVIPKSNIKDIFDLNKHHLCLLENMRLLAIKAIETVRGNPSNFKIGFHALPSMQRLHLHVVSDDFVSESLKTKLHWNSFNTAFFIPYENLYQNIEKYGQWKKPSRDYITQLIKSQLKCHKCSYMPKNMPSLKSHLMQHV